MAVHDHLHHPTPEPTPTGAPAPDPATLAAWAALGPALSDHACILAERDDILVTVRPEGTSSGAPAQFTPATATIDLDAKIFPLPPQDIRPHRTGDQHRYPAAYGALTHEGAHAAHSRWQPTEGTSPAVLHAAELLEESRIEARHTTRRPADRAFLRACAIDLVLDEVTATPPDGPYAAATAAALILGRETAGILEPKETAPVRAAAETILGAETLADLEKIWSAAHQLDDEDTDGLLELGKAWTDRVNRAAGEHQPSGADPDPAASTVSGDGQSPAPTPPGVLGAAIAATARAVARAVTEEHPVPPPDPAEVAAQAAEEVFGRGHGKGARARRGPVTGTRPPTGPETAAAGALARALREAAYRERVVTTTASELPPGRLSMRGALTRDAQRAAGAMPTAKPFAQTRRHATPTPPLRVGIAVDVSGSMTDATGPIASAAWILARATSLTDPLSTSATVAFGSTVTAITRPGPAPAHVTTFAARDGWEAPTKAADALDAALGLSRPGAARLLILATDGLFGDTTEQATLPERLRRLAESGCALLHLAFSTHGRRIPHTGLAIVTDPAAAIDVISKAATAALRAAR
jgi:hypothetical protein